MLRFGFYYYHSTSTNRIALERPSVFAYSFPCQNQDFQDSRNFQDFQYRMMILGHDEVSRKLYKNQHHSLLTTYISLFTSHFSLFTFHFSLFTQKNSISSTHSTAPLLYLHPLLWHSLPVLPMQCHQVHARRQMGGMYGSAVVDSAEIFLIHYTAVQAAEFYALR